jgi:hypothetical protein
MASSPQTVPLPEPEVEKIETARLLPQPEKKETPFVIKAVSAIPC